MSTSSPNSPADQAHAGDRRVHVSRQTKETQISVDLNLDGTGQAQIDTGIAFFNHMLEQIPRHSLCDATIVAKGDLEVDDHHTVEDVGIVLGQSLAKALGDNSGIVRYGHALIPLDEALTRVIVDISGRPGLYYRVGYPRARIGQFDVDLVREFFQALANHARLSLHIDNLKGENAHHICETVFKAFARALRMATSIDPRLSGSTPSTKGVL